jgi:hypothetical protein
MTRQLDVDRVLEDWLAEGPSRFPERAVWQTIDRLDDIQQRRPSRLPGSQRMHRFVVSAAGLAAALVVAVVALGSLDRSPRTGSPTGVTFTSERHGYSVVLPENQWRREERPGVWVLGEFFDANSPSGVDYFERLDQTPLRTPTFYVYLSSQPIPDGMTFDEWVTVHDAANAREMPCFGLVGAYAYRPVAGENGRIATQHCDDFSGAGDAWTTVQTLVAHGGRGYAVYVWPVGIGPLMPAESELEAVAADWLARFSFSD